MHDSGYRVADAHCDYLYHAVNAGYCLEQASCRQAVTLERLLLGGVRLQFFAAWVDIELKNTPFRQCLDMIAEYNRMLKSHKSILLPLSVENENCGGAIETVLTVEGLGDAIAGELINIDVFYMLGVRAATLTWNFSNALGYPSGKKYKDKGLTRRGKAAVRRMCELGMAVDVSHLSDAGIDDVLKLAVRPVFASHSNARTVFDCARSLSDRHIKAIAEQGGVIGINFYSGHLTKKPKAGVDDVVKQIMRVAEIAGINHVCIGSDFDGMDNTLAPLAHPGEFGLLIEALSGAGMSHEQIKAVMYDNLRGYIAEFCA